MGQVAAIFPGQGAQAVGMGKDVCERSPRARAVFERAGDQLGFDLARLCFDGPVEDLEKTDIQQPAIFVTSVALWEAFLEAGGSTGSFDFTAGLSLGEYTALHVAEAIGFDEALRLVRRRGVLMQEAAMASPSGMVSLVGADEAMARTICDEAREDGVLVPANFNCPGQVVVSGSKAACERVLPIAESHGCRGVSLPVAGAFHSPLMEPAAAGLAAALKETSIAEPRVPVLANVTGRPHGDPDAIRLSLERQVTEPVRWQACIETMIASGVDHFVEIGPGRVLTGLMRKIDRRLKTTCVNSADAALEAAAEERMKDEG